MKNRTVLVTGGAGYIGSHMCLMLADAGARVVVLDNLSRGHRDAVFGDAFVQADLHDGAALDALFSTYDIDLVLHFAAYAYVGESVHEPLAYYTNNVAGTLSLLRAMQAHGVRRLVFSSTCATYGVPETMPIAETAPQRPINPYGQSKLMMERILTDCAHAWGLNSVALRYFNAAGADAQGRTGERHDPETHLIPLILERALRVRAGHTDVEPLQAFGHDLDTPDGSCVRDYVHVTDLCDAHLLAGRALLADEARGFLALNLGTANGYSVRQVIDTCREITGVTIPVNWTDPRAGDPPVLVGDASLAAKRLGWRAERSSLENIVRTAWRWHESRFTG